MAYLSKENQAAASRRHYLANKEKMIARAKIHKDTLRKEIGLYLCELKVKTPCIDCTKQYPPYVMQFDHVTGIKEFNLADNNRWTSWNRVLIEIEKCEIVCSNCHAERTYQRRIADSPSLV
jgi:hypothetical protein